jgi:hypothetical protein
MAIKRPDIYEHNNPLNAIVDSDFVRGGTRTAVNDLNELYQIGSGINDKLDQLKAYSTRVYVSGENKFYLLTDIDNRSNISGWTPEAYITTGDTGIFYPKSNPSGFITGVDLSSYATVENLTITGSTLDNKINILSGEFDENNILGYTLELNSGIENLFVPYPSPLNEKPSSVTCSLQNFVDNVIYHYMIGQTTMSGFFINFSDVLTNSGYLLNVKIKK